MDSPDIKAFKLKFRERQRVEDTSKLNFMRYKPFIALYRRFTVKSKKWIHCGEVLSGAFFGPNKVSMNKRSDKFLIVTSHLEYSPTGVQFDQWRKATADGFVSGFFVDGVYQARIVKRFNFLQKDESWLA